VCVCVNIYTSMSIYVSYRGKRVNPDPTDTHAFGHHEQPLVCLSNREIVAASRARTFHYNGE